MKNIFAIILFFPLLLNSLCQVGPPGADLRLIEIDSVTGDIYASSQSNHFYKISNGNWQEIITQENGEDIYSFSAHNGVVFLGIGDHILKSIDGGSNWYYSDNGISNMWHPSSIEILKNHSEIVLAKVSANVWYRSINNGVSWYPIQLIGATVYDFSENTNKLYMITSYSIYISDDLGDTWSEMPLTFFNGDFFPLSFTALSDSTFVVGGTWPFDPWGENSVYLSNDQGTTWNNINYGRKFGIPTKLVNVNNEILCSVARSVTETEGGIFQLDLENDLWRKKGTGIVKEVTGIAIDNNEDSVFLASLHEGIFKINILTEFTENYVPSNIYHSTISSFEVNSEYPNYIYQDTGYFHFSSDNGNSWSRIDSVYNVLDVVQSPYEPNKIISSQARHGILISNDYGQTWTTSNNGIDLEDRTLIYTIHFLDDNIILISGFVSIPNQYEQTFIYRSTDSGESWVKIMEANTTQGDGYISIQSICAVDDAIYAALYSEGIFRSFDEGLTWEQVFYIENSTYYELEYDTISGIFYTRISEDLSSPGRTVLYKSLDGINWNNCSNGFDEDYWITSFSMNPNYPNQLFCSTRDRYSSSNPAPHIMYSIDSGVNWNELYFNNLADDEHLIDTEIQLDSNEILFTMQEKSILSESLDFVGLNDPTIPNSSPLTPYITNYPNPFNPSTTISFNIHESGLVKLDIYNIKGQKVKTLLDCTTVPGTYECNWNGKDEMGKSVSSGQYIVKLKQNEKETAKKIMMLK